MPLCEGSLVSPKWALVPASCSESGAAAPSSLEAGVSEGGGLDGRDQPCSEVRNRPTRFDHSLRNTLHGPSASSLACSTNGKPGSPYHRNEDTLPASSLASTNGKPGSVPYHRNEGTLPASSLASTNADAAEVCHARSRSCRVPRPQPFTPSQANPSTLATSPSPRD